MSTRKRKRTKQAVRDVDGSKVYVVESMAQLRLHEKRERERGEKLALPSRALKGEKGRGVCYYVCLCLMMNMLRAPRQPFITPEKSILELK